MAITISILGATGKTGMWAMKGGLDRAWNVRVLARKPEKVLDVLKKLYPEKDEDQIKSLMDKVTVVKGSGFVESELKELMVGADVVMSFVGMVNAKERVVEPMANALISAMKAMGGAPKKFIMMSSIGFNDGRAHGKKAWGRMTMCCLRCIPAVKASLSDMADAERFVMETRTSASEFNLIIARATILADKKDYFCDYTSKEPKYNIIKAGATGKMSYNIDRQNVAQAFLDLADNSADYDNQNVSLFELKK